MQLLIVDDQEQILSVLGDFLEDCGHDVVKASDGAEAMKMLGETDRIEAILSDIRMPKMNGIDFLKGVRLRHPGIPVVLMTGHGDESIATTALQEGAFNYLKKPVRLEDLMSCVSRIEERSQLEERVLSGDGADAQIDKPETGVRSPTATSADEGALRGRFLLIDADGQARRYLQQLLLENGHEVDLVNEGREAEDRLRQGVYDAVISELELDDMDGYSLIQRLKVADPTTIAIAMTSQTDRDTVIRAMRAGARGLLTKPLEETETREQIQTALVLK